jgi:hypothetical protein
MNGWAMLKAIPAITGWTILGDGNKVVTVPVVVGTGGREFLKDNKEYANQTELESTLAANLSVALGAAGGGAGAIHLHYQ